MGQGLRRARERAVAADPEGARHEFFDVAHDALHRLAAEVAEGNRAGAARLLEAKQAVEQSLAQASPALAQDLDPPPRRRPRRPSFNRGERVATAVESR